MMQDILVCKIKAIMYYSYHYNLSSVAMCYAAVHLAEFYQAILLIILSLV